MDKEKLKKIYEEYGQIHEDYCGINDEGGSDDGCTCAVKTMVTEIVTELTRYFSYDLKCANEEQRRASVKLYLEHLLDKTN